jgi:hypothetical protein
MRKCTIAKESISVRKMYYHQGKYEHEKMYYHQ